MLQQKKSDNLLLFTHTGNTGGGAIFDIIIRQYSREQVIFAPNELELGLNNNNLFLLSYLPENYLEKIKMIGGHSISYGIHNYLNVPCSYITLVREPVEHIISTYYWSLENKSSFSRVIIDNQIIPFEKACLSVSNFQLSLILGYAPKNMEDLEKGKEIIKKHFAFISVTEMFDEIIFFMKLELNWKKHIFWYIRHKTKKRPKREELPDGLITKIIQNNELDYQLYYFIKKLMNERINSLNPEQQRKLKEYSVKRKIFTDLAGLSSTEFLQFEDFLTFIVENCDKKLILFAPEFNSKTKIIFDYVKEINDKFSGNISIQNSNEFILNINGELQLTNFDYLIIISEKEEATLKILLNKGIDVHKIVTFSLGEY